MKHFIGTLLGMVFAASAAFAGIMPSLEVSGAGVVISASKPTQTASITIVNAGRVSATNMFAGNISNTVSDITTLRAGTISSTGAVSATGTLYAGGLLIANSGISTSSILTLNQINGVSVSTANISLMAGMNQGVSTTSSPTFAGLNITGVLAGQGISGTVVSASINFAGKGSLFQHCTYNASSSTVISTNGLNCGVLTRISTGYYGISFTTPSSDISYTAIGMSSNLSPTFVTQDTAITPTTEGYALRVTDVSGSLRDTSRLNVMVTK